MIFVTGDTHGSYSRIATFCQENPELGQKDIMIVLGDTGLNYYGDERDQKKKNKVARQIPLTMLFIHGNHDLRPQNIPTYQSQKWREGIVWSQEEFPRFLFARDSEIFDLEGKKSLVIGGAYSVDKQFRLEKGYNWFADEQPSAQIKAETEQKLQEVGWTVDTVLSHTCPLKYEPKEAFFSSIDQSAVDKTTETWLGHIEDQTCYRQWFCGHFHIDKKIDRLQFLFKDIVLL